MNLQLLQFVLFAISHILRRVLSSVKVMGRDLLFISHLRRRSHFQVNSVELWEPLDGDLFRKAQESGLTLAPIKVRASYLRRGFRRRDHRDCSF